MTRYDKLGGQPGTFVLYQAVGGKQCSPISDGTSFTCSLWFSRPRNLLSSSDRRDL